MTRFKQYIAKPEDYTFYLDLDGVLVDFIKGVAKTTGKPIKDFTDRKKIKKKEWTAIADAGSDFWSKLNWMKDGKDLWKYLISNKLDIYILSAFPQAPENKLHALKGKIEWIKRELKITNDKRIHLVKGQHKKLYAEKLAILIDDSSRNIEQFRQAGGIGILHTNTKDTIKQLEKVFETKRKM